MKNKEESGYVPEWDDALEGYTVKKVASNMWRLKGSEFEDVMQEARLRFVELCRMYPNVDNASWTMGLYKISLHNLIHDLAYKDFNRRKYVTLSSDVYPDNGDEESEPFEETIVGDLENDGMLLQALSSAPKEVIAVLSFLMESPASLLRALAASWKSQGHRKEFGNQHLCRILGYPSGTDLEGPVKRFIEDYQRRGD